MSTLTPGTKPTVSSKEDIKRLFDRAMAQLGELFAGKQLIPEVAPQTVGCERYRLTFSGGRFGDVNTALHDLGVAINRSAPETLQPEEKDLLRNWSTKWAWQIPPAAQDELDALLKLGHREAPQPASKELALLLCRAAAWLAVQRGESAKSTRELIERLVAEVKGHAPETGEGNCLSCYQSRRASFDREAALSARASELQYIVEVLLSIQKHGNEYARESATDLLSWLRNRQSADTSYEARAAQETCEQPRNWAIWRCYRHERLFAAHAGCSMCATDPDPSGKPAQKASE